MKPMYAASLAILFAVKPATAQEADAVESPPAENVEISASPESSPTVETTTDDKATAKPTGAAPAGGLSEAEAAKANNPLADMTALNLHNYYMPESKTNTAYLRFAKPFAKGRLLMRATLPILTMPNPEANTSMSGIGDLNVFLSVNVISKPTTTFGFGPLVNAPTAVGTDDLRDAVRSKWQLGAAMVLFKVFSPVVQFGSLLTWQMSLGDSPDLRDQNLVVAQPFLMIQLGKGIYLRSAGMWTFDIEYEHYTVPFGLGIGKVSKAGKVVFNGFLEPTFTLFSNNPDQPLFQLFAGLNLQFLKD